MRSKKLFRIGSIILILMVIFYLAFQHYDSYKKKERYKDAIITELLSDIWLIETHFSNQINSAQKKTDQLFKNFLEEDSNSKKELEFQTLKNNITYIFSSITSLDNYFGNETWEATQQSEILSQFSMYQLKCLNKAYGERQKLITVNKELQKFSSIPSSFLHPLFSKESSQLEIREAFQKHTFILSDNLRGASATSFALSAAIEGLDAENEYLKEIDSLRTKKLQNFKAIKNCM